MTLLSLSDVSVEFGATTILQGVTFSVAAGERWGIVGRNGAGKTTIFRLITGQLAPTRGAVALRPALRITYLDQHCDAGAGGTVWDAAAHGFADLLALEQSLTQQGHRLAELGERITEAELDRYGHDQERFGRDGGYEMHARVDAVLHGLGFDPEDAKVRPAASLSGGERGRVGLAATLATPADLVLLDEPTNHLDLDGIDWLQRYIADVGATVLVISHDRAFLDDAADHTLHVAYGTSASFRGGYSAFVTQLAEQQLTRERQVSQQRKSIAKEEDYIRRNIAGQNTAQAKGRRKRLDRLPRLSPPPSEDDAMRLRFRTPDRGGDQVIIADHLDVKAGDRRLIRDFSAVARRGDVIALVGPNGAGKTTLISTLLGELEPGGGTCRIGSAITAEWYRQDLTQLPVNRSIYDCIADLRPLWNRGAIQGHLGTFGFSGDDVFRSTAKLSGGERARVALALITLSNANLLVLDEPTNHLDVESIEALEDALEEYEGTVLLVSHDRAFLRELTTRVWSFDRETGDRLDDYGGPFVEWETRDAARAAERAATASRAGAAKREATRGRNRAAADARRDDDVARRSAQKEAEALERTVHELEAQSAALKRALEDERLYDGSVNSAKEAQRLEAERAAVGRRLEAAMAEWMKAETG